MAYTTIDNPELYFQTKLYTGTGSSHAITLDGSENMQPDWVWIKRRNSAGGNMITDSIRGVTKTIITNENGAEQTFSNGLTAFDSDGFTLGSEDGFNKASDTFVSWNWSAGGSASSNSNGSITSSVSANTTAGFSIVTYTGNGTAGATVGHGLGSIPQWIIVKVRNTTNEWVVYHTSLGATKFIEMNSTGAVQTNTTRFNDTEPTSSVFSLGTAAGLNTSSDTHVAYCFAEKKGYSKFGSYTGNGNADGTFVYTGFRPAWVMVKRTDSGNSWCIFDNKRPGFNETNQYLLAEDSRAELTDMGFEILSNGFKLRQTFNSVNGSGASYIYLAFAESPFVNSNGVPNNAR